MALNTRFLDEFDVKYLTGSDNDTCAYDTLWPWCGRTLPRSGVNVYSNLFDWLRSLQWIWQLSFHLNCFDHLPEFSAFPLSDFWELWFFLSSRSFRLVTSSWVLSTRLTHSPPGNSSRGCADAVSVLCAEFPRAASGLEGLAGEAEATASIVSASPCPSCSSFPSFVSIVSFSAVGSGVGVASLVSSLVSKL